jgi:4-amino-4-deoxy-L-arabinose transferase-like glycosyltransferase
MDDPLFIWTAHQIRHHPFDFYGFMVDWDRRQLPMPIVMQNPPGAGYFLALTSTLLGWSEQGMHFGFLLQAVALVLGTYLLGRRFSSHPFAAGLATLAAPVFILASTSLMCDTLMVALWVWAIVCWTEGLPEEKPGLLIASGLLVAACGLTKYFGVCLIPLLFAFSLTQKRRVGRWVFYLCIPALLFAGYQWYTAHLYGTGLLVGAAAYAGNHKVGGGIASKGLAGLAFTGGCVFISLSALPLLWGRKGVAFACSGVAAITLVVLGMAEVGHFSIFSNDGVKWPVVVQIAVLACGGIVSLLLAAQDLIRRRTPEALLLFLWTVGTFVFASAVNWTVSGRNILPLVPAVSLLVVRRLEWQVESQSQSEGEARWGFGFLFLPIGISLAVALTVGWGDLKLADAGRRAAFAFAGRFGSQSPMTFEGHWGFQYYFEQLGATALDTSRLDLSSNELVVVPLNNTKVTTLDPERVVPFERDEMPVASWLTLMSHTSGAGYYCDNWGPAPFIFCHAPNEDYVLLRVQGGPAPASQEKPKNKSLASSL